MARLSSTVKSSSKPWTNDFQRIVITQTKVSSRLIVVERVINVDESNERQILRRMNEKACYVFSVFLDRHDDQLFVDMSVPVHTVTLASVAYVARIRLYKLIDHARGFESFPGHHDFSNVRWNGRTLDSDRDEIPQLKAMNLRDKGMKQMVIT